MGSSVGVNKIKSREEAIGKIENAFRYDSKILTRIAGGAAPDIIATEVDYFVTFATKNVLEDLSPNLAK